MRYGSVPICDPVSQTPLGIQMTSALIFAIPYAFVLGIVARSIILVCSKSVAANKPHGMYAGIGS